MRIGYACLIVGRDDIKYKTCKFSNASKDKLKSIIAYNLESLSKALEYNRNKNIELFRISSNIIPFGSNKSICIDWQNIFKKELNIIGKKIRNYKIRVSMHPGQYTVLNSPNKDVVNRAIDDLKYHTDFLNSLGLDESSKIILHIGGVYGNKNEAIKRFINNYELLDSNIKNRLVIENDDKSYNINDVLNISNILDIPVVYDNLHNFINCYDKDKDDLYWIKLCSKTWKTKDGNQKIHYSEQDFDKQKGSHSSTIDIERFTKFYKKIRYLNIDIMLEVKDKDISAIKCIDAINNVK
jgi:UV DNA damage endonuclease